MKKLNVYAALSAVAAIVFTPSIQGNEVPRQFRIWGSKAPEKLSQNPVPGKIGIESLRIPKTIQKVDPETNMTLDSAAAAKYSSSGMVPFAWHPMRSIYSVTAPTANIMGKAARAIATPGEYVPLVAAVYALDKLSCVEVTVEPFKDKAGKTVIPRYFIDLRRIMDLPSPLRSDPSKYMIEPRYLESFDEFDILNVKKDSAERFWLTVKIPENCPAGIIRSTIKFQARGKAPVTLPLMIRVLPFTLEKPDPFTEMTFSMLSGLNDPRVTLWARDKQPQQALRQMADMAEHGMTSSTYEHCNPAVKLNSDKSISVDFDKPGMTCVYSMNDFMHMVNRSGLTGPFGLYNGPYEWAQFMLPGVLKLEKMSEDYNNVFRQLVRAVEDQRKKMKWQQFIWFVGDEPAHDNMRLKLSENAGRQVLAVLPDAEVTNFFNGMHSGIRDWEIMRKGASLVCANFFNESVLKDIKKLGYKKHWNYNSAMWEDRDTRAHRIAYGLLPWALKSTGVTQYVLRESAPYSKGKEFAIYDQINFGRTDYDYTYPAADGPLPTPDWESVRQGVYDYYYFYTLRKLIKAAGNIPEAEAAQAELDSIEKAFPKDYATPKRPMYLDNFSPETLDAYRWRVTQQIMKLRKALKK